MTKQGRTTETLREAPRVPAVPGVQVHRAVAADEIKHYIPGKVGDPIPLSEYREASPTIRPVDMGLNGEGYAVTIPGKGDIEVFSELKNAQSFVDSFNSPEGCLPEPGGFPHVGDWPIDYPPGIPSTTTNKPIVYPQPVDKETTMADYKKIPVSYNAYGKDAATLCDELRLLLDLGLEVTIEWTSPPKMNGGFLQYPPGVRGGLIGTDPGVVLVNNTYEENGVTQPLPKDLRGPSMGPNYRNGNLGQ
jgi:hypothetical protein